MTSTRLAIDGGEPAFSISPPWPVPDVEVEAALQRAFADGSWGKYDGPHLERLIRNIGEMHQLPFVLPCCSGTFAVELALRGLRVEPGAEVILAGYDFPGNFRAIEAVGAVPVLVDLTASNWCLDVDLIESAISTQTRAIIVSHLHGGMVDMQKLRTLADHHGIPVVEDACQASGAMIQGRTAGAWGDVGVLSFGGSKLLTAGRGGAIMTNREDIWQRAKIFSERGNQAFPLSELQAVVLLPQLPKLAERNIQRGTSVKKLLAELEKFAALRPVSANPASTPSYYKVAWRFVPDACADWSRERFLTAMQTEGVAIDVGFRGFVQRGNRCRRAGTLSNSKEAADSTVLLHHPILLESDENIRRLADAFRKVVRAAQS